MVHGALRVHGGLHALSRAHLLQCASWQHAGCGGGCSGAAAGRARRQGMEVRPAILSAQGCSMPADGGAVVIAAG